MVQPGARRRRRASRNRRSCPARRWSTGRAPAHRGRHAGGSASSASWSPSRSTDSAARSTSAASSSGARGTATSGSRTPTSRAHHAEIRQEGTTYWIVDLGSTNGLEVNGKQVKRAKLEDADRMTVGSTELVFGLIPVIAVSTVEVEAAARAQARVPRHPLPLHLAHRPHGQQGSSFAAGKLHPRPRTGRRAAPAVRAADRRAGRPASRPWSRASAIS